jgi:protein-disulfide isomerase
MTKLRAVATLLFVVAMTVHAAGKSEGVESAPVRIDVYSDFQCPACKALHEQTLNQIEANYVRKGKIYLVNHDFPLPMHEYARQAALYASAAARVGKYEQVADALFAKQESWSKDGKVEAAIAPVLSAAELKKVRELWTTPEIAGEVDRDIQMGKDAKVNQTPTMIISRGGKTYPVAGVVSYSIVSRFLDQLLGQ